MRTGVWLLAVVALAGTLLVSIHSGWINSNLLALLPQPDRDADVVSALDQVQQSTVNQILALTQAPRANTAARAAQAYARALQGSSLFKRASAGLPLDPQATSRFYRRYRFQILTGAQRRMLRRTSVKTLAQRALRRAYAAPGQASGQEIATDPLGLFRNALQSQLPHTGWRISNGTPVRRTSHGYAGVVRGALAISPFSLSRQRALRAALNNAAKAARQTDPSVQLLTAGVVWHALAQSRQARWEISTIGLGSTIAVVVLIIGVFRSLRPLFIGILSLAAGCLAALCATELIFGQVYLFTLVFGASLIGVAIDYDLHVFADRFAGGRCWSARSAVKHLSPGLILALTTSILGYAALALTPLPGLRQIAFFSVVGLIAAWASVVLLAPGWGGGGRTRQPPRLAQWTDRTLARLYRHPVAALLLLGVLCVPGWLGVHFSDDVAALRTPLPQRDAMERHVRTLLGAADENQFFLVTAADAATALQREANLGHKLDQLRQKGALRRWRGLVQQVPPPARQRRNYQLLADKVFGPQGAAPRAWRRLGFSAAHIARQKQRFRAAATRRLTLAAWLKSPASQPLRDLWLGTLPDGNVGTIVLLGGIENSAALNRIQQPGVQWIDPVADLTSVLTTQRRHIGVFLLLAYLLVGLVLARVYGKRGGLRTILPPAAASIAAVSALGWAGEPLDLFALFALLLVLGIGVDYTIFLREAGRGRHRLGAWSAVGMSAITTALAFGLLALSRTPAIHRFGFTLLIGIGVAWLLAPLARESPWGSNERG